MATNNTMTEGTPWKHILKFAFPVLGSYILQQLYATTDSIIVGNFTGEEALAAVGTTGTVMYFCLALAMGFSAGNGVVVSQAFGAKDEKTMRAGASSGILFVLSVGLLCAIVCGCLSKYIYADFMAAPPEILGLSLEYFNICMVGLTFLYGYNIFSSILLAVGDSAAALYFQIISTVVNIVLDLIFVAYFKWGVAGAAWATSISHMFSCTSAFLYMRHKHPEFRFKLSEYKWDNKLIWLTVKMGFPIALQAALVAVGIGAIIRAVNSFGKHMTASFAVAHRIELILTLPAQVFHTALATYAGQNIGAGKMDRVKLGAKAGVSMAFGFGLIITSLVCFFTKDIINVFALSEQAGVYCFQHIRTAAFVNLLLAFVFPVTGIIQGAGHSSFATFVAIIALIARVGSTYLFIDSSFFGYQIIWWNNFWGFAAATLITLPYYISGRWQNNSAVLNSIK